MQICEKLIEFGKYVVPKSLKFCFLLLSNITKKKYKLLLEKCNKLYLAYYDDFLRKIFHEKDNNIL